MKKTDSASSQTQAGRFRAMAEELECDPDEAAFKAKLAVIAKAKPKDEPAPKNRKAP